MFKKVPNRILFLNHKLKVESSTSTQIMLKREVED